MPLSMIFTVLYLAGYWFVVFQVLAFATPNITILMVLRVLLLAITWPILALILLLIHFISVFKSK